MLPHTCSVFCNLRISSGSAILTDRGERVTSASTSRARAGRSGPAVHRDGMILPGEQSGTAKEASASGAHISAMA
jgi:hypothetical protein